MNENVFQYAKWIWADACAEMDSYADFYDTFVYTGEKTEIQISADSNYVLFINGEFVNSGQYPDFPHYKVYDTIDISAYCKKGENSLAITVWYYGLSNTITYYKGNASLRYEVYTDTQCLCFSDASTLSRISPEYKNGYRKIITNQLGLSFMYYAVNRADWKRGSVTGFSDSTIVEQQLAMFHRPVKKVVIGDRCHAKLIKSDQKKHFLYDIGREEVGYFTIKLYSSAWQKITVCYGEHIADGCVRRKIDNRDFSFEMVVDEGYTSYTNYFRGLGSAIWKYMLKMK